MPIRVATVRAADVPASQTDFPFFIDLGRVGATALTLAEAESSRWYTDTDLVTQLAREIVSLTEGHGKYASLTSTSKIAIDYDGIRADYAVGDTYGRNNVWTDYTYVAHMEGNADNSTGGTNPTAVTAITFSAGNGLIGQGAGFNGTNSIITIDLAIPNNYSISYFGYAASKHSRFVSKDNGGSNRNIAHEIFSTSLDLYGWNASNGFRTVNSTGFTVNTWHNFQTTWASAGNFIEYRNGTVGNSTATGGNARNASSLLAFGGETALSRFVDGRMDEIRIRTSVNSANWITTEYNNQNDEAAFWGTWTTFGGGGFTPTPLMHMRIMASGMV